MKFKGRWAAGPHSCYGRLETSGLRNHACLQAQTKCDAGTGEYQENVREAEKQLTHDSNEPVRQTNSIYVYFTVRPGWRQMSGLNVYFCLVVMSVSCMYINLEQSMWLRGQSRDVQFIRDVNVPLRFLQLCSSINFTQASILIELQDAVSMENRTLSSSVRECRGK